MIVSIEITPEILSRTKERLSAIISCNYAWNNWWTAIPEVIVGVAIAVALVPSAAVTGIGIGLGSIDIAVSASNFVF